MCDYQPPVPTMHSLAEDGLDGGVETKRRSVIVMEPVAYEMHLSRAPYIPIGTSKSGMV